MVKKSTKKYTYALGRRKASIVTIKMYSGKGNTLVNNLAIEKYFTSPHMVQTALSPFVITDTVGKFYFEAKVKGGGKSGQSIALRLAVSRALDKVNQKHHPTLKAQKFLTVDSRVKERRKIGTGGKARRQKQSPKR